MALACTLHGCFSTKSGYSPQMHYVSCKLIFEKKDQTYRPGEIICGSLNVTNVPRNTPDINGLLIELEGHMFLKDTSKDTRETKKIIGIRRYFLGNGTKKIEPLKEGDYKFTFTIPEDCPPTFTSGKFGWIKYTINCIAHQSLEGFDSFQTEDIIILAKTIGQWKNHKYYIQPMFGQKQISSFLFSGKVHIWLNTDQKCYQPGDEIKFILKVKNSGGKNVRGMILQLQQIVTYTFESTKQFEKIFLVELSQGPSVPVDYTQTWNGRLKIPSDLQPSIEEYCKPTPISYQYNLRVTLQMAGSLVPNMNEEFSIQIGCPLDVTLTSAAETEMMRPQQHLSDQRFLLPPPVSEQYYGNSNSTTGMERRMSACSLAPSLPDYDTAMSRARNGIPPPSYSCLDLNMQ